MREVDWSSKFKKEYRKLLSSNSIENLPFLLGNILDLLQRDIELPPKNKDHLMIGKYKGTRNCHIKPDLVLLYIKVDDDLLILKRIGSHSELGI